MRAMTERRRALIAKGSFPHEYQRIEWLRFSASGIAGNSTIIDTGINYSADFELKGYSYQGGSMVALGISGAKTDYALERISGASPNWALWVGETMYRTSFSVGALRTISYRNSVFSIDGNTVSTSIRNPKLKGTFILGSNGKTDISFALVLYHAKLYDPDNGRMVRYFIPCYRKADSVLGLYDLVTNNFYTNIYGGTFVAGPNV